MHEFDEIALRGIAVTLSALNDAALKYNKELEDQGCTIFVKGLQAMRFQKAVLCVGVFSMFEAKLQDSLNCENGFAELKKRLLLYREFEILKEFETFKLAINVLKHGRGRSYDQLVANSNSLPFSIRMPDNIFFEEGDITEVATLVDVTDEFVTSCVNLIRSISEVLRRNDSVLII